MKVMVFDVGGTEIKYSVMDDTMNYYESGSVPTPSDSQEHFSGDDGGDFTVPPQGRGFWHRAEVCLGFSTPSTAWSRAAGPLHHLQHRHAGGPAPCRKRRKGAAARSGSRTTAKPPPSPNCSGVSSRAAATRRCSSSAPAWAAASLSMASWCGAGTLRRGSTAS